MTPRFKLDLDPRTPATVAAGQTFRVWVKVSWITPPSSGADASGMMVHFGPPPPGVTGVVPATVVDRDVTAEVFGDVLAIARVRTDAGAAGNAVVVASVGALDSDPLTITVAVKAPTLLLGVGVGPEMFSYEPQISALDINPTAYAGADLMLAAPDPANPDGTRGYDFDPVRPIRIALSSSDVIASADEVVLAGDGVQFTPGPALLMVRATPQFDAAADTATLVASYPGDSSVPAASMDVGFPAAYVTCARDTAANHTFEPGPDGDIPVIIYDHTFVKVGIEAASGYVSENGVTKAQVSTPGVQLPLGFMVRIVDEDGHRNYNCRPGDTPDSPGPTLQVQWRTGGGTLSTVAGAPGDGQFQTADIDVPVFYTPAGDNSGPACIDARITLSSVYDPQAPLLDEGTADAHRSSLGLGKLVFRFLVRAAPSQLAKPRIFRIHPAIGVARVGNADRDQYFIGPEPGSDIEATYKFAGKVKRQAARFRLFEYRRNAAGRLEPIPGEITTASPGVLGIEWTAHLANRKAAFHRFKGASGESAEGSPEGIHFKGAELRKKWAGEGVTEIDFLARTISSPGAGPVTFERKTSRVPEAELWPATQADPTKPVIDYLGELRMDASGRLLVLGGQGKAAHFTGDLNSPLPGYANNPGWYDDISDGPVSAVITLRVDGAPNPVRVPVERAGVAWVLVAPPDFAPNIANAVSLYDTLLDVAVRRIETIPDNVIYDGDVRDLHAELYAAGPDPDPFANTKTALSAFMPRFDDHIGPLFEQLAQQPLVHARTTEVPSQKHPTVMVPHTDASSAYHGTFGPPFISGLDEPVTDKEHQDIRNIVLDRIRPQLWEPKTSVTKDQTMPNAFGDAYNTGEPGDRRRGFLLLTQTQALLLKSWGQGRFVKAGAGVTAEPLTYDVAALKACVGGAFYPGIEASWQIRQPSIFIEPFRIDHDAVSAYVSDDDKAESTRLVAGHFSRQMAQPWHADFHDCAKSADGQAYYAAWWPAQRPDDVLRLTVTGVKEYVPWGRADPGVADNWLGPDGEPAEMPERVQMVRYWSQFGFILDTGTGVAQEIDRNSPLPAVAGV
jgi:hypothetical protein